MSKKLKIERSHKRTKWNILGTENTAETTTVLKDTHTEIFGNERINIDGCLGVCEYKDTYIKLRLRKGTLILCGTDFDIVFFENRLITVKGKISSLEFCV